MNKVIIAVVAVVAVLGAIFFIDFDITDTGELPEVAVEGGRLPSANIETGDVDVGSKKVTVEVPTVDLKSPEEERLEEGTTESD